MPSKPTGASYKQVSIEERWDAIVIGSGIGGLTTAALLAQHAGKRVLVLERHYTAGGFTHAFHRPGYEWDVGVHYIGQVQNPASPVRAAFDHVTEGRLAWHPMPDVYDQVRIADRVYEFPTGMDRFRDSLLQSFPAEGAAIDRYLAAVLSCVKASNGYFAEKAIPRIAARLAGAWMRAPFLRWANSTTAEVLAGITTNRELIGVLAAQWGDYGLPPPRAASPSTPPSPRIISMAPVIRWAAHRKLPRPSLLRSSEPGARSSSAPKWTKSRWTVPAARAGSAWRTGANSALP